MKNERQSSETNELGWGLTTLFSFMSVAVVAGVLLLIYSSGRDNDEWRFSRKLQPLVSDPYHMGPGEIREQLGTWLVNYEELQVPASFEHVYQRVEKLIAEVKSLQEGGSRMSVPEYHWELKKLQNKALGLPNIGPAVYQERYPWGKGFLLFIGKSVLFFIGIVGAVVGLFLLAARSISRMESTTTSEAKTTSSTASSESSGGGGGGYIGVYSGDCPPPGMFRGGFRFPEPESPPPHFPYWR